MDRESALLQLATAHAVALRLRASGAADEAIAEALGIPVTSVAGEVRIAEAKLAAQMRQPGSTEDSPSP